MIKKINNIEYIEQLPDSFDLNKKYPIIIHLHGAGARFLGMDVFNKYVVLNETKKISKDYPFIVFIPHCNVDCWFDIYEQLKDFIREIIELPYVDKSRVFYRE